MQEDFSFQEVSIESVSSSSSLVALILRASCIFTRRKSHETIVGDAGNMFGKQVLGLGA